VYHIAEFAALTGLSRTALLYYEKLKLIAGQRQANGYRVYSERDYQRVRLIQQLQKGGLTLAECKSCLEQQLDYTVLRARYVELQNEIEQKQDALNLLAALLGKTTSKTWHETLSGIAPEAYLDWLKIQGYDEKQALRIKWLSKDMNEHEQYMQDFMSIFSTLESWGPGSAEDTAKAFGMLSSSPESILEIGCGNGNATLTLASLTDAQIIAIDNEQSALDKLQAKINARQLSGRLSTQCLSMTALDFTAGSFDLIWAEASIYVMGVQKALAQWKPLLEKNGQLVFSDLVWLSDNPNAEAQEFWRHEYPDMQDINTRLYQIAQAGYQILDTFTMSTTAWKNYYEPLQQRLNDIAPRLLGSQAVADIQAEVDLYGKYLGEFGYQFFVLEKR
jgi:DNA-binding transcriptional MerR regulator